MRLFSLTQLLVPSGYGMISGVPSLYYHDPDYATSTVVNLEPAVAMISQVILPWVSPYATARPFSTLTPGFSLRAVCRFTLYRTPVLASLSADSRGIPNEARHGSVFIQHPSYLIRGPWHCPTWTCPPSRCARAVNTNRGIPSERIGRIKLGRPILGKYCLEP